MKMLSRVVTLALSVTSPALIADTEFGDDVPREVVTQLVGNQFGGEAKLYSDIFDAFPAFTLPAGFEVLASADQGVVQRVILRTELGEAEINNALTAAFVAEGWMELPAYGRNAPQTGFVSAMPPPQPVQLCSDQLGRLSVSISGVNPRYATLSLNNVGAFGGNQQSCAELAEMMEQGPGARPFRAGIETVQQYMPALIMPESDVPSGMPRAIFGGGGGGGSSSDYETRGFLAITWSGEALLEHFAAQVEEQDWSPDSEASGLQVAFGSWTKTVEDAALLGMLTLTKTAENTWDMKFRIVRQSAGESPAADRVDRDFAR